MVARYRSGITGSSGWKQLRLLLENDGYALAADGRITSLPREVAGAGSLLKVDLTEDQRNVLAGLYWSVTRDEHPSSLSWPIWNFVRSAMAKGGVSERRADDAIMTLPEVDAGSTRRPYSLIWRSAALGGRIQPSETVGLSLAGVARVRIAAADALASLVQAAADREAALPVDPYQLPSGQWDLDEPIRHFMEGSSGHTVGRKPMNVPTVAHLLMHEPIPLAEPEQRDNPFDDPHYSVELGARLGLFRDISNASDYLRALDTLVTPTTQQPGDRAIVESPRESTQKESGTAMTSAERPEAVQPPGERRRVFLVHGRNDRAKDAMVEFLRSLELSVIGWGEAKTEADRTTELPPSTLQIVSAGLQMAHAVVVLFTPDDLVCLDPRVSAGETDLQGQPRPNVILEAGMVLGMAPKKAAFVRMGAQREISDIAGMHFHNLGDSLEQRRELVRLLRDSRGLAVVDDVVRWSVAGKFDEALAYLSEPRPFAK
ncbi:TIR domain-containing protein [Micromonospora sp.]|uniref:TIR domain-containing protein n=1 Tax=Micromonospora sp. TaxID=1876 RepID=UPI003B3BBC0C